MKSFFTLLFSLSFVLVFAQNNPSDYFVTTWKTDNRGHSNDTSITISTHSGETYNYDVDWNGDGIFDQFG